MIILDEKRSNRMDNRQYYIKVMEWTPKEYDDFEASEAACPVRRHIANVVEMGCGHKPKYNY